MKTNNGRRPNILWISFEDTYPYYGCYGDSVARTPNLDRFASGGCLWTNCFATAGVCAPARSAIITGMYPISIGTQHMRTTHQSPTVPELPTPYSPVVPPHVKCFSEYFRAAGYFCSNNEKTDYQFETPLTAWDDWGESAHWRNRPDLDQPFFAVFNPGRTHESGMWEGKTSDEEFDLDSIVVPPYLADTMEVRKSLSRMYSNIERSDQEFGELLQQLEDDGLTENTYIFHWSDHGPLPRGKRWLYDAGIRVPLIARGPDLPRGVVSPQLVSTIDLAPTMLSLAGIECPKHLQGQVFAGPDAEKPRDYVYASRDRIDESYDRVRAVRDERFKYIRNYYPDIPYFQWVPYLNKHPIVREMIDLYLDDKLDTAQSLMFQPQRPVEELYDTRLDPHEINNLAADEKYAEDLKRLGNQMDHWLERVGDLGEIDEAEMVRQWYPDGVRPTTAQPKAFIIGRNNIGGVVVPDREVVSCSAPNRLMLYCASQGASLAYTLGSGESARWQLYTKPLKLEEGTYTLRVRAVRVGYFESQEARFELQITSLTVAEMDAQPSVAGSQ
ncbi:sulfatase family protein [Coraliomargarita parva]|uniref:sulfatase family protein n=1 Tax=Coraliomargarita parva TaxID=3014050 RepID=UPI0022B459D1|nr:sulfatase [Coraliomargarita parva]